RQVEARIAQADAQVRRTEVVLGWTAMEAPVNGQVVARRADPGSAIFPGSPLLEIETTGDLQVLSSIPTQHRGLLSPGLTVTIRPNGDPSAAVQGKIAEIVPASDPGSHSTAFRVDLPAGFGAPPGAFVTVDVPAGSRAALLVPKNAVRETGQLSGIFVLDSTAHARFRLVKVAPRGDDSLELLSGAVPGDRIVLSPSLAIVDGTPVEIRP
ncbi:MAG: efflux RND transporter periplasmic adaptor subunit, partial [Acidobacteriota bacterium]